MPSVQNSSDCTLLGRAQAGWPPSFHGNSHSLSQHCSSFWLASKPSLSAVLQRCHLEKDDQKLVLQKLCAPVLPYWQLLDGGSPEPLAAVGGVVWWCKFLKLAPRSLGLMLYLQVLPACASSSVLLFNVHLRFSLPAVAAVDISKSNSLQCWAPLQNKEYWTCFIQCLAFAMSQVCQVEDWWRSAMALCLQPKVEWKSPTRKLLMNCQMVSSSPAFHPTHVSRCAPTDEREG